MSDTRIPSSLPPSPDAAAREAANTRTVRLISVPERIYEMQQAARVRAEVVRANSDGTVQLRSAAGEITVRPEKPDQLTPGQTVEVRIPAERPPRTAEIRPAPPERPAPSRGTQTDVDVRVSRPDTKPDQIQTPDDLIGRIVRAVPLPPSQVPPEIPQEQSGAAPNPVLAAPALPPEFSQAEVIVQAIQKLFAVRAETIAKAAVQTILAPLQPTPYDAPEAVLVRPVAGTPPVLTAQGATEIENILKGVLGLAPNGLQVPLGPSAPSIAPPDTALPERGSLLYAVGGVTSAPTANPLVASFDFSVPPPHLKAGEAAAQVIGPVAGKDALAVALVFPAKAEGPPSYFALLEPGFIPAPGALLSLMPLATPQAVSNAPMPPLAADLAASVPPMSPAMLAALPLGIPYFLTPEPWPVLQEIAQILAQASAPIAQAFSNMIPNPAAPQQMAPAALFFLAAMRGGDVEGWLGGRATDALRRAGRGDLITRLSQEGATLSRMGAEPLGQEWKATSLPLSWQEQILKIPVYYKRSEDERGTGNERGDGMVRFVINLDLSRMGKMQMDALYREAAKRFDLILRSTQPFTKAAEHEMRGIFAGALEDLGLRGEMGFQTGAEKWVTVQPDKLYEFSANF